MPPRFIALLLAVICAAGVTVWLISLGGSGALYALAIVFLLAAVVFRVMGR